MKKKIFLTIGVLFFAVGIYYFQANYEVVYYPNPESPLSLESRSIGESTIPGFVSDDGETVSGFRIGDFVIRGR